MRRVPAFFAGALRPLPFLAGGPLAARSSINTMKAIDAAIDRIDMAQLADIHERQDPLAAHRLVTELLLGGAPVA